MFYRLNRFAQKADVRDPMRVSISFGSDDDKARFKAEALREMEPGSYPDHRVPFTDEMTVYGIRVRLF